LGPRESFRHAADHSRSIRQAEKRVNLTSSPWAAGPGGFRKGGMFAK
jgi:hypothetical protein